MANTLRHEWSKLKCISTREEKEKMRITSDSRNLQTLEIPECSEDSNQDVTTFTMKSSLKEKKCQGRR